MLTQLAPDLTVTIDIFSILQGRIIRGMLVPRVLSFNSNKMYTRKKSRSDTFQTINMYILFLVIVSCYEKCNFLKDISYIFLQYWVWGAGVIKA